MEEWIIKSGPVLSCKKGVNFPTLQLLHKGYFFQEETVIMGGGSGVYFSDTTTAEISMTYFFEERSGHNCWLFYRCYNSSNEHHYFLQEEAVIMVGNFSDVTTAEQKSKINHVTRCQCCKNAFVNIGAQIYIFLSNLNWVFLIFNV